MGGRSVASAARPSRGGGTEGVRRTPRRCTGSGEADVRGLSPQPGGSAVVSPIRQTPAVDTVHRANTRVLAGGVVKRCHGDKPARTVDGGRSAGGAGPGPPCPPPLGRPPPGAGAPPPG